MFTGRYNLYHTISMSLFTNAIKKLGRSKMTGIGLPIIYSSTILELKKELIIYYNL